MLLHLLGPCLGVFLVGSNDLLMSRICIRPQCRRALNFVLRDKFLRLEQMSSVNTLEGSNPKGDKKLGDFSQSPQALVGIVYPIHVLGKR